MFRTFLRTYVLTPTGALILSSVILSVALWYIGPLISVGAVRPLETVGSRMIAIGGLLALTVIIILVILLRQRRKDTEISNAIVTQAAANTHDSEAVKAELQDMQKRMKEALQVLRKSRVGALFGARHLYQLPWYIMIGPPGAGKTTAIVNSGLKFPLADHMGAEAIGGVGGTRNCDWWFTNDAVLLDTAGRYTTQDSDQTSDSEAWSGFLDMLKRHRRRQPINGALVAISLSDLSAGDEATSRMHAHAIRVRLQELRDRLGVRFPVYVLFTKADLIAGFQEFFENLGSQEREQVWGLTLPLKKGSDTTPAAEAFRPEFDALLTQLSDHSLERMQTETDYQRRSLIAGFPAQMASLRDVADNFLSEIFQESRYAQSHLLRGVYFTSGTQEGMPIDRLMAGMSRTFGIGRQAIGTGHGQGRSFFLTRLMNTVIFGEAGLVSADDAVERRYRWITRGAVAASAVIICTALGILTYSYRGNAALIETASAQINTFQSISTDIPKNPIADEDLPAIVPALNILRDLPGNPSANDPEPPRALTYGLYQGDAIGSETAQSYRAALNNMFLPRLLVRLEQRMQANLNNRDILFDVLKTYLMLGLQVPIEETHVAQALEADWAAQFPGQDGLRADLRGHLGDMLTQPMQTIALNGPLIEQVQGILAEVPLSERVYQSIVNAPQAKELDSFRITDVGGPAAARVLVRPSGKPLSAGLEGVYTHTGFYDYVLPQILVASERIQRDSLILGPQGQADTSPQALALLSRDVLSLYENDYVNRYNELLADIDILPMSSVGQATDVINILSGPVSPLRNVLRAVSKETKLATPPATDAVADAATGVAGEIFVDGILSSVNTGLEQFLSTVGAAVQQQTGEEVARPGQFVQDRFRSLHELADGFEGGPSELDRIIQLMTDVYDELNRLSLGQNLSTALVGGGDNAAARLQAEVGRLPPPMERWAAQVSQASSGAAVGGVRNELNAKWSSQVLPFCQRAIDGRYPFNRQARSDVALLDFGRLFGPSGLMDKFFNENLAVFVDTTQNPWRVKRVNGIEIGISDAVVAQFQKASEIRDSFFLGAGLPAVNFDVTPVSLDPSVEQVTLEVEGQTVSYAHGPPQVSVLSWPVQTGGRTRIAFSPSRSDVENTISQDGPWALFRLLDAAELRRTNVTDRSSVAFNIGGRRAVFQLRAASALNPFTVSAIDTFRCPASL